MRVNVLIACEESQTECMAFRKLGFNAYSCVLQPCKRNGHPEWHILGDVTSLLCGRSRFQTMDGKYHNLKKWHLIIAHPPCTYLCKVGSMHMYKKPLTEMVIDGKMTAINKQRYTLMKKARSFFMKCLCANADFVAVENPLPMAMAHLPKPDCYVQPFWFGHKYSKKTLYWLRNLPPIMAEASNPDYKCFVTSSRGKYRSRTFAGVAAAIARQWGLYVSDCLKKKPCKPKKRPGRIG